MNWTFGNIVGAGTTTLHGSLLIDGFVSLKSTTLRNFGTVTWTGKGTTTVSHGASIENMSGATFDLAGDGVLMVGDAAAEFHNAGTFRKTAGNGTAEIRRPMQNTGVINVQTGTLELRDGASHGQLIVDANATLAFAGAYTLAPGSEVSGQGTVAYSAGTTQVLGSHLVTHTDVDGGTVQFVSDVILSNLRMKRGILTGTGDVEVTELLEWSGGTMTGSGNTRSSGDLLFNGTEQFGEPVLDGRRLQNAGSGIWTGPVDLRFENKARFTNLTGATFEIANTAELRASSGARFNNFGTLTKTSRGSSSVYPILQNYGKVEIRKGIAFFRIVTATGDFTVQAGATVSFSGDGGTFEPSSRIQGAGTVALSGSLKILGSYEVTGLTRLGPSYSPSNVYFPNDIAFPRLELGGGTLRSDGIVTVDRSLLWTAGTVFGVDLLRVNGTLTFGVPIMGAPELYQSNLEVAGTVDWRWGFLTLQFGATVRILPNAHVYMHAGTCVGDGTVHNFGTIHGVGNGWFGPIVNSGEIVVHQGRLTLQQGTSAGPIYVEANALLEFRTSYTTPYLIEPSGSITGAGNVIVDSYNGGLLTVNGTYSVSGHTTIRNAVAEFNAPASMATLVMEGTGSEDGIAGAGDLTVNRLIRWQAFGGMKGAGKTYAKGGIDISFGAAFEGRHVINSGNARVHDQGSIGLIHGAVFTNLPGAVLDLQSSYGIYMSGSGSALVNDGTIRKTVSSATVPISVPFTNNGTLAVDTGTLHITTTFTNWHFQSGTLIGGQYLISGTLQHPGFDIKTNDAHIVLNGPNARMVDNNNMSAIRNLATNTTGGVFELKNGAGATTLGSFQNRGSVSIGAGSLFTTGFYTQSQGTTSLAGGTLNPTVFRAVGGSVVGYGTIDSNVLNAAEFVPGGVSSAGILTITGDYTQASGAFLRMEVGGDAPGADLDQLLILGVATLDGELSITLLNNFTPQAGDEFQIVSFASHVGVFSTVSGLDLGNGLYFDPVYSAEHLTLVTRQNP
jgi:hypothetical protein